MTEKRITRFDQFLSVVKGAEKKKLAIASAEGGEIIEAVKQAVEEKIISPVLIGDQAKLAKLCGERKCWAEE